MSRLGERKGHGVVDGDPVAIILLIGMMFVLLFWLGQSGAINPISCGSSCLTNVFSQSGVQLSGSQFNSTHVQLTNGTITRGTTTPNNYSTAFNNTKWLLWLLSPMALYIIVNMGFDLSKDKVGLDE